jgi:hypothetical protein
MQVLLFVFTILMAMSIMTYQRIAAFKDISALRHEYVCYMEQTEHADFNEGQEKQYKKHHGKGPESQKDAAIGASRYLNLYSLFAEQGEDNAYKSRRLLLVRLLEILYGNQPFYQEMAEKRPNFVQEMIDRMIEGAKKREPPIKTSKTLTNLELNDKELQHIYVKMFLGNNEKKQNKCLGIPTGSDYDSLSKYVRVQTKVQPIRVQLAPTDLLLAIFEEPDLVQKMLEDIKRLRNSVVSNKDKKTEASIEFERLYKNRLPKDLDPSLFNFEISSSRR